MADNNNHNNDKNNFDMSKLPLMAMDEIPAAKADAKEITALVKEQGKVTGYQLSDGSVLDKSEAISLAKDGGIQGVGIAHNKDTEYLKSLPDEQDNNNLGNLPSL